MVSWLYFNATLTTTLTLDPKLLHWRIIMECMIFIYLPPLFLSQIQIVASKLEEARYIPFGDQSTKTNNQNKHLFSAFN